MKPLATSIRALFARRRDKPNLNQCQLSAGQVWQFRTARGFENATLIILKIEDSGLFGRLVHIAVDAIPLQAPNGTEISRIAFMPFSEAAIRASVLELLRSDQQIPDFAQGYSDWVSGDETGGRGVFTVPVNAVLNGIIAARGARQ